MSVSTSAEDFDLNKLRHTSWLLVDTEAEFRSKAEDEGYEIRRE